MKPDRLLIAAVLFLATGLGLIFEYCHGTVSFNAALPVSGSSLVLCTTTTGPAALGGFTLTVIGVVLLIWALICSIIGEIRLLGPSRSGPELPKG